jgi:hypothetical protein
VSLKAPYAAKLSVWKLPPGDVWMGKRYQLHPQLIHGAVATTHSPKKLEETFKSIRYTLLSSLKGNRHIMKEFQMLPTMFQGLALPNPKIDGLSRKIRIIQNKWGMDTVMGKRLNHIYQVFQMDVELSGNIFTTLLTITEILQHTGSSGICGGRLFGVKSRIHDTYYTSHSFVKMTECSLSWSLTQVSSHMEN